MAEEFEDILNKCITLVLQGVPVQECLARYPKHARELEPQLRVIARLGAAYYREPRPAAFQRSRQRLQAEMQALERAEQAQRRSRAPARFGLWAWGRRWAFATAALVLALFIWQGTAAASAALPGERLYSVKHALERVRLALEPSIAGKAGLEFAYAERRANEIAVLISQGSIALAEETAVALDRQLAAAGQRAAAADVESAGALKARLEASASRALSRLEGAAASAPEVRDESSRLLTQVASEYAQASESLAAQTEAQYVPGAPARLQLYARLLPPPGVQAVLVDVSDMEAYLAAGVHSRWVTVGLGTRTLGLSGPPEKLVGESEVESGLYTRVRFRIVAVTAVTARGRETLPPPEGPVELQRPLSVAPGRTTSVLLDFDGLRSIVSLPEGGLHFVPELTVRVLDRAPRTGPPPTPTPEPGVTPTLPKLTEVSGVVAEATLDRLMVGGQLVVIFPTTEVQGVLELGARVRVTGIVEASGVLVAARVVVETAPPSEATPTPTPAPRPSPDPTSTPASTPTPALQHAVVIGPIISITPTLWVVDSTRVAVGANTVILGLPAVGVQVRVEGITQPDGSVLATRIEVLASILPSPAPSPPPVPTPTPTLAPAPTPTPQATVLIGTLTSISPGLWTVDGVQVVVNTQTVIEGLPLVGLRVRVEGTIQPDGSIVAVRIITLP